MGIGPGADTHVLKFCGSVINHLCGEKWNSGDLKSIVEHVAKDIPAYPGIYTK